MYSWAESGNEVNTFGIKIVAPVNIEAFVFDKILITAIESRDTALEKILISGMRRFNKAFVQPAIPLCLWQKLLPWTFG
jgi:hypothetical protein